MNLNEIDLDSGTVKILNHDKTQNSLEPYDDVSLSASAKIAIGKLRSYLSADEQAEVRLDFKQGAAGYTVNKLNTGPSISEVAALNKLDNLLDGTGYEKEYKGHGFNEVQTAVILQRLPSIDRQIGE